MTTLVRKRPTGQKPPSLAKTTHNRVLIETSEQANELAIKWGCTKIEVYRWLVQAAIDGDLICMTSIW